jgi:hypothetical protein
MNNFYQNQWHRCYPLSKEVILDVEKLLRIEIPFELQTLFLNCNGGKPEKTYFANDYIEVEVGSLLPIHPPEFHKGESFETVYERLVRTGLPSKILPFAYDNGNSGIFCLDGVSGEIFYWVLDPLDEPLKKVAISLNNFMTNLTIPPY